MGKTKNPIVEFIFDGASEGRFHTVKTRRPRTQSLHRGRTFDYIGVVKIDGGKTIDAIADTSWGTYAYFNHEGRWYKLKMGTENAIVEGE